VAEREPARCRKIKQNYTLWVPLFTVNNRTPCTICNTHFRGRLGCAARYQIIVLLAVFDDIWRKAAPKQGYRSAASMFSRLRMIDSTGNAAMIDPHAWSSCTCEPVE
jgi:hypothetical protein